jgi:1-acyl-sn-glycerol-3-phosphate acyltransferase
MKLQSLLIKNITTRIEHPIVARAVGFFLSPWVREVKGLGNIPRDKNFLVSANHASYLDHLIVSSIIINYTGKAIHYLAKKEHFQTPFQRRWHEYTGAIPIDRQAGGQEALKVALKYLKKNKIIGVYPEGTRTLTGKLQKGKTGVARLALGARVPVLPIGLKGTFQILPKGRNIPRLKRATVNIGKLMYFKEYYGKENDKKVLRLVTTKVMKEIAKLCGQRYDFR